MIVYEPRGTRRQSWIAMAVKHRAHSAVLEGVGQRIDDCAVLAKFGPGPSAEEIDQNRKDMFRGFAEAFE